MKKLFLLAAVAAALLVPASSASASLTGEFARFSKCPVSNPKVSFCVYAESTSGSFTIGAKTVPLKNPVILQGGLEDEEELFGPATFAGATDGNTLSKTAQPVPGGLLGVTPPSWWPTYLKNLFEETINNGFTGVTATVELAAPASAINLSVLNTVFAEGVGLGLPVKIKLDNPFLGSSCYIGSNSHPVQLNMTTGTTSPPLPNKPISGSPGTLSFIEGGTISILSGNKLVDNSFAAPGASGCGGFLFSWAVDPLVNSILGVPAAAGTNTAILEGKNYIGSGETIREKM